MKQNKGKYVSPIVEAMNCKVEKGFQCSGCEGSMLENPIDGGSVNGLFD